MPIYLVATNKGRVCIEVPGTDSEDTRDAAMRIALASPKALDKVRILGTLPYPTSPRLAPTSEPAFCNGSDECLNRGSCPKEYACND